MFRFSFALIASVAVLMGTEANADTAEPAVELVGKLLPGAGLEESSKGKLVIVVGEKCVLTAGRLRNGFTMAGIETSVVQADIGARRWVFYHDGAPLMLGLRGAAPSTHTDCSEHRVTAQKAVRAYLLRIGALQSR